MRAVTAARWAGFEGWAGRMLERVPFVVLLLAPACVLAAIAWITPEGTRLGFATDLDVYRGYAQDLRNGLAVYRDVPIEYPPLAILPMMVPLLIVPAPDVATNGMAALDYLWRFLAVEALFAVAVGWLIYRTAGRSRSALALWTLLVATSWVAIGLRYDIWPVACVAAAILLVDRRPGAAGLALGLGTMLKLYPAVLLPILAIRVLVAAGWRTVGRLVLGWGAVVSVVMGAAWAIAGPSSLDWLRYQGERGLQVESLGASLLMGLHLLTGQPVDAVFGFGSVQLQAPGAEALAGLSPALLAALLVGMTGLAARRFRADQERLGFVPTASLALAGTGAIAALLVGSKVLSVQYALWLVAFVPLLPVRLRWLALAIAELSTAIYTIDYVGLWHFSPLMIVVLLVRNALLVGLLGALAWQLWRRPAVSP